MQKVVRAFPLVALFFATGGLSRAAWAWDSGDFRQGRQTCSSYGDTLNCQSSSSTSGNVPNRQPGAARTNTNPWERRGGATSSSGNAGGSAASSSGGTGGSTTSSSGSTGSSTTSYSGNGSTTASSSGGTGGSTTSSSGSTGGTTASSSGGTASPGGGATTPPAPVANCTLYVSNSGSDSNSGTQGSPLATIYQASTLAQPGTTVCVAPGTYSGGFTTSASGTASAPIHYLSTTKYGAKIVPPSNSTSNGAWDNEGNYVIIDGFEIDGTNNPSGTLWSSGIYTDGSYGVVQNNLVHDIAKSVACNSQGAGGIVSGDYRDGVHIDIMSNIVHDIGPAGCNFDQGIYVSTSGGLVKNNIAYNIASVAIHLWHNATNVTIVNNTAADSPYCILVGSGDWDHGFTGPDDNTFVANNICYNIVNQGISEEGYTGTHNTYLNNLMFNVGTAYSLQNGNQQSGGITANPLFVNRAAYDFHLQSGSPAIGAGTSLNAPSTDLDGNPRPTPGAGYDLGAYQHIQ